VVLCETKREFCATNCTMWCAHICSDVGEFRCNIKYRANTKFLDIGKCTKIIIFNTSFCLALPTKARILCLDSLYSIVA
jgi:hypothetical protein